MKWVGLLDCNNFFVSCERLFRPDLRTTPTVVLSSNDGCVVARSKEVKDMGIPMGVPYFKVKEELIKHKTAVFSSNFPLYRDISTRVMAVLKEEMDVVEQYSVDEAFFEIVGEEDGVFEALSCLKNAVESRVGVPVSVGAAKTKTIAKYASEVGKKTTGTAFMHDTLWQEATKTLQVSEIWGIGRQTTIKMRELGILTVADFLSLDRARIDRLFGIGGLRMHDELSERPVYHVGDEHAPQKSIMSTRSFKHETKERAVVEDAIAYHVAHAAEELREMGMKAGYISVLARTNRHGEWFMRGGSNEALLPQPTNDTRILLHEALQLFDAFYEAGVPYKKAGVVLGMFTDTAVEQMDLFGEREKSENGSVIMEAIDSLNRRFGSETVMVGRQLTGEKWKTSKAHVSPCYTTNWDSVRVVEA